MDDIKDITFSIVNKDGLEMICDAIKTYTDEETDKLYVAYTDYSLDENGKIRIYLAEAIEDNEAGKYNLINLEDEELQNTLMNETFKELLEGE